MTLEKTRLHILRKKADLSKNTRSGVSLHCHTEYSKEMLDFVPHYAEKLPIISYFWRKERDSYMEREKREMDFSTAYWSPPLSAFDVYRVERSQIENANLEPIVSLTDHDCIDATLDVNREHPNTHAPISMEWTVPFEYGFFHVGVHNLPEKNAVELTKTLLDFTFDTDSHTNERLTEMFSLLNEIPQVLVVLNHPLWDIEIVGQERHELLLKDFIRLHGRWIHAFEVNGFRSWSENKAVIELAEALGMPLVTGGDRHGCKPNTVLNLTNASSFEEFVDEVRTDKRSEIVLMPEYSRPLHSRQLGSFAEILSHYPGFREGHRRWYDRVYFDTGDGNGLRSLSDHGWKGGGPKWLRWAVWTLGILGSPAARPIFTVARKREDRVPRSLEKVNFKQSELGDVSLHLTSDTIG